MCRRRTGGGISQFDDAGKIMNMKGVRQMHAYILNKYFPVPAISDLIPCRGFFKKWVYTCYLNDNNDLIPISFDDAEYKKNSMPMAQDLQGWGQLQRQRIENTYGEFWNKYSVLIGEGIVALTLIIVSIIVAGKIQKGSEVLAQAISQATTVLQAVQGLK